MDEHDAKEIAPYTRASGLLGGVVAQGQTWPLKAAEAEKYERQQMIVSAVHVLARAQQIRADAELMAAVRAYVRAERDSLGVLLDDIA